MKSINRIVVNLGNLNREPKISNEFKTKLLFGSKMGESGQELFFRSKVFLFKSEF